MISTEPYYRFRAQSIPEKDRAHWNKSVSVTLLWMPIPAVERATALLVHIFTKAFIVLAVQQNIYLLFWLSFGFKSLVDGIAAWMHLEKDIKNVTKASQFWAYESIFIVLALISIVGIILLQRI